MTEDMRKTIVAGFLTAALVATGAASATAAGAGSDKTAQSIMVNAAGLEGPFALAGNKHYRFDIETAKTYFTNTRTGGPEPSCSGNNCGARPGQLPEPLPDASKLVAEAEDNLCTFLNGGTLTGTTYQQSSKLGGWTWTWTYTIAPSTPTVAPRTAWVLVDQAGGNNIKLGFSAVIAGESVQQSSNPKIGRRYSFSLVEGNRSPTMSDVAVQLDANKPVHPRMTIASNIPGAQPGDRGAVDFSYTGNAGSYGSTSLLADGDARGILNGTVPGFDGTSDQFAGNDNGGADGSALAKAVVTHPVPLRLGIGSHTVKVTGTVKGNTFSVADNVQVFQAGDSCPAPTN